DFTFPRASPAVKFVIVLITSWVTALIAYGLLRRAGEGPIAATTWGYIAAVAVTALFHIRYVRTQREFLVRPRPWLDFLFISVAEVITCMLTAMWVWARVKSPTLWDYVLIPFGVATVVRYVLRKEMLQDVRGLRRELRHDELT